MSENFKQGIFCHSERSPERSEGTGAKNPNFPLWFEMLHYAVAPFSMTFLTSQISSQISSYWNLGLL
ncbi:hypothetical protein NIES4073_47400 [Kalymmatonema gypsitolerans NIES-4073]|nr:hypothetical protein NIES4073_47400 [Scytonema sp. NIES-4073]